jgi:hypothetical protein
MNTIEKVTTIIRMQNIHLLKYIAYKENWNYIELCKNYLR